jgi:hypothetical protein
MSTQDDDELPQARAMHGFTEEGLLMDAIVAQCNAPRFLADARLYALLMRHDLSCIYNDQATG